MIDWERYLYVLAGVISAHTWIWIRNYYQYKYKWECPGCTLIVRTSSPSYLRIIKNSHKH